MQLQEFLSEMESTYTAHFPESRAIATYSERFGVSISVSCKLAGNKSECANNYWENDPFHISFFVYLADGCQLPKMNPESQMP
ncbi:MAG: hypothetical protein KAR20_20695, partial [Candidatus Heimdallarchaeota archaeon]|nr:hypothetical protein [Candidatus Heimdallarchaeota archaeon]